MLDFNELFTGLEQRANGSITVDDYTLLVDQKASATIQVDDYTKLIEAAAVATIVVDDYTLLNENASTGTITVDDYDELHGNYIIVNGQQIREGDHFDAETSNDVTAENIKDAIEALTGVGATRSGAVVTITATTAGVAGDSIDMSTEADALTLSGALLTGGRDYATITVDGDIYTAGTDFDAETTNDVTATNIATAIDTGTNVGGGAVTDTVTITASAAGSAGNALAMSSEATAGAITLSGALLAGGQDHAEITVDSTTLVQGTDFDAVTDEDTTATNIAAAIDAIGSVDSTATTDTVTTEASAIGVAGNSLVHTATFTAGGLTLSSDTTLLGGQEFATITVGADVITEGTDFDAETDNDTTATNIAAALDALGSLTSSATDDVATVYNTASGVAGNSKVLQSNVSGAGVTLSGAFLTGGLDETLSEIFDFASTDEPFDHVQFSTVISDYVAGALTITPQVSTDKVNFKDMHDIPDLIADGLKTWSIVNPEYYVRFKLVTTLGGDLTLALTAVLAKGEAKVNGFGDGIATVASAGTAVPLSATSKLVRNLSIQAKSDNTGSIYQGGSDIGNGGTGGVELVPLSARDPKKLAYCDLADIYINADTSDDKAVFSYEF